MKIKLSGVDKLFTETVIVIFRVSRNIISKKPKIVRNNFPLEVL